MKKSTPLQAMDTLAVFALISLMLALYTRHQSFVVVAVALLVVALFIKPLAGMVAGCWLEFSELLSSFSNKVILSLLFFIVLTPIAYIYRRFTKDPLGLDLNISGSCYKERNHIFLKEDLEKLW